MLGRVAKISFMKLMRVKINNLKHNSKFSSYENTQHDNNLFFLAISSSTGLMITTTLTATAITVTTNKKQ